VSRTISPNASIAQYTIVSKIGEGGIGEVWARAIGTLIGDTKAEPPTVVLNWGAELKRR
jgi:hypothetical protein